MSKRKATIPTHVREEVWRRFGGVTCWCCQSEPISSRNKHFGHVVAEANGGLATVDNLRPTCPNCNLRMGTENMYDFMSKEGFPLRDVAAVYRVIQRDPVLTQGLKGKHVYAVPTITDTGQPAPEYDYVLAKSLAGKYPFLEPVIKNKNMSKLFHQTEHMEIIFHFVVRPDYVRWIRNKQEAIRLVSVELELY